MCLGGILLQASQETILETYDFGEFGESMMQPLISERKKFFAVLEASTISLYASAPPPLYLGDTLMSSSYGHLQDWPKILPKLEYLPKY